jgi:hypothetical protein
MISPDSESKEEKMNRGLRFAESLSTDDAPGWRGEILKSLKNQFHPVKRTGTPEQLSQYGGAYLLLQFLQLFQALRQNPNILPIDQEARELIISEASAQSGVEISPSTNEAAIYGMWEEILETILTQAFEAHIQGKTDSNAAFLEGLTKAAREPWLDPTHNPVDTAFPIYATLLYYQDEVEKCRSVPELHRWLSDIFGESLIGDIKRLEKICQRIGLRFRGRGRPRKPKS